MLNLFLNPRLVLACLEDCPADNHARQLAQFLYGTLANSKKMKIKYKKKRFNRYLIFGILWTILGFLNLNYSVENNWMDYGFLVIAILYWSSFFTKKAINT